MSKLVLTQIGGDPKPESESIDQRLKQQILTLDFDDDELKTVAPEKIGQILKQPSKDHSQSILLFLIEQASQAAEDKAKEKTELKLKIIFELTPSEVLEECLADHFRLIVSLNKNFFAVLIKKLGSGTFRSWFSKRYDTSPHSHGAVRLLQSQTFSNILLVIARTGPESFFYNFKDWDDLIKNKINYNTSLDRQELVLLKNYIRILQTYLTEPDKLNTENPKDISRFLNDLSPYIIGRGIWKLFLKRIDTLRKSETLIYSDFRSLKEDLLFAKGMLLVNFCLEQKSEKLISGSSSYIKEKLLELDPLRVVSLLSSNMLSFAKTLLLLGKAFLAPESYDIINPEGYWILGIFFLHQAAQTGNQEAIKELNRCVNASEVDDKEAKIDKLSLKQALIKKKDDLAQLYKKVIDPFISQSSEITSESKIKSKIKEILVGSSFVSPLPQIDKLMAAQIKSQLSSSFIYNVEQLRYILLLQKVYSNLLAVAEFNQQKTTDLPDDKSSTSDAQLSALVLELTQQRDKLFQENSTLRMRYAELQKQLNAAKEELATLKGKGQDSALRAAGLTSLTRPRTMSGPTATKPFKK